MALLQYQPLKGIYLLFELLTTAFVRVPLWTIVATCGWRPRSTWTTERVVLFKIYCLKSRIESWVGPLHRIPDHHAIAPEQPGISGIWIEPTPELVTGQLKTWTDATGVAPAPIPGYWTHKTGGPGVVVTAADISRPATPGESVLFFLHGGGYTAHSAHPSDVYGIIPRGILQHSHSIHRSFAVEYRLSCLQTSHINTSPASNPFPAALLDALAGYTHLINIAGFLPENIIILGDSAGANLAHALTRYLVEHQNSNFLRPPGRLVLLSPWTDLSDSLDRRPGTSAKKCSKSDYINVKALSRDKDAFLGPLGFDAALRNPYISPASLDAGLAPDFKGFPRTFIDVGGAEIFYDQISIFKDRMVKDLGDRVTHHEVEDAFHDYLAFGWYEPERTNTLISLAQWLDA